MVRGWPLGCAECHRTLSSSDPLLPSRTPPQWGVGVWGADVDWSDISPPPNHLSRRDQESSTLLSRTRLHGVWELGELTTLCRNGHVLFGQRTPHPSNYLSRDQESSMNPWRRWRSTIPNVWVRHGKTSFRAMRPAAPKPWIPRVNKPVKLVYKEKSMQRDSRCRDQKVQQCSPGQSMMRRGIASVGMYIVVRWRMYGCSTETASADMFHNEWDLNSDFDPTARFETEEEEDEELYFGVGTAPEAMEPLAIALHSHQPVEKEGLGLRLVRQEGSELHPEKLKTTTLEEILAMVHGIFIPPSETDGASMSTIETQKVERCKSLLSGKAAERDSYNVIPNKQLTLLYDGLLSRGNVPHRFPAEWSDVDPSSPQYLLKVYNKTFKVSKIRMAEGVEAVYAISDGKETSYELIIPCASAVLLALHHGSSHTLDELIEAVERIPYRMKGSELDMEDYSSYMGRHCQLFKTNEILCAALKHGGLIWRLAIEEVPEDYVITGPRNRVTQIGGFLHTAEGNELWDEMLMEDQINVICGVYKVECEGGRRKKGFGDHQQLLTEHLSWFPKDASWRGSRLDVGFWSANCEYWYQRRVERYLGGDFKCETQTEWKRSLKLWRDAPKVSGHLEHLSRSFLEHGFFARCKCLRP
ncbi:hypothetical protein IW261DRAFT_1565740 [Armillaria novae-zelandiae]|uniref:Uncharacterized protein n=1 Tax=Armillaria novae-zelandiae TaxID=153914 RepID=A0AA39U9C0_9AGAR|nr:hypothetical protein IW261DRAFT_1565740 [Armillaria novae-zelandiae]